ncbi:MAG: hypothetical protein ACRBCK_07920 [Alphaproteobacteria bacterium]
MRNQNPIKIQNTKRDINQSNFEGVLSATEMTQAEAHAGDVGYSSIQGGGGTFYHKPMMEGRDPWDEFEIVREAYPDTPISILVRGDTLVGYDDNPDDVIEAFVKQASDAGVDIFTIFDGFNDTRKQGKVIEEVKKQGKHAQGVIAMADSEFYTMDLYKQAAQELNEAGADSFYIKDPVGIAPVEDVYELVDWLKTEFPEKEVHIHAHNTHGEAYRIYMAAIEAGVDTIDCGHPASAENVAQPSVLRMVDLIANHPDENIRARTPELDIDAINADSPALSAQRFQYRDKEPVYDADVFETMHGAKAPGGAASTLKSLVSANAKAVLGLEWDDAQKAIYNVQEKMLPLLGDPLQVTPHAKNTTTQAAITLISIASHKEYGEKIKALKNGPNASKNVLNYITDVLNDDTKVPSQGRGRIPRGEAFVIDGLHKTMTVDIAKYLAGRLGKLPGQPDEAFLKNEKVVAQEIPEEHTNTRPSELLEPAVQGAIEQLLAAGHNNPSANDIVTVAMWNNEKQEGFSHVDKKLKGELVSNPAPELPKYAQNFMIKNDGDDATPQERDGAIVKTKFDVFNAIGGAASMGAVAELALESEKDGHYKAGGSDGDKARADSGYYEERFAVWREEAQDLLDDYIESIPQKLHDSGFSTIQMLAGINMANEILEDVLSHKGVSAANIPVIDVAAKPSGDYEVDARFEEDDPNAQQELSV